MRSLHLITTTARRGAEIYASGLADDLNTEGQSAAVVALTPGGPDGLDVHTVGTRRRSPLTIAALRRMAKSADVVVAHGSSTLEASAIALAGSGIPFVYRSIGDPSYWANTTRRRSALALLHRCPTRHVALWAGAARALADLYGVTHSRIDVIPNAVSAADWQTPDPGEEQRSRDKLEVSPARPCLAYVGALSAEKNVAAVLGLARSLDAAVLIVGDGPQRARLADQARRLGGDTRFLGTRADLRPVYAAADLVLLPSRTEGMPGVIIEAGLMGTPAVATAVGGVPEMLGENAFGFLAPADDNDGFHAAVRAALPRAAEVGRAAASQFRTRYTFDSTAPLWVEALQKAVA